MISSENKNPELHAAIVPFPGELIREELSARGWTQRLFAEILGRPYQVVNQIIKGKKSITAETSLEISAAFGTPGDFWYRAQAAYDYWLAEKPEVVRRTKAIAARASKVVHAGVPLNGKG
jgi:addiction module HigA family antidote